MPHEVESLEHCQALLGWLVRENYHLRRGIQRLELDQSFPCTWVCARSFEKTAAIDLQIETDGIVQLSRGGGLA